MQHLLRELQDACDAGQPIAYTALVETRGSTPQKAGAAMLVFPDSSQSGTLGGGCVEAEVKRRALRLLDDGQREILTFHLDNDYGWDDGLICGGRMRMLVDPIRTGDDIDYFRQLRDWLNQDIECTEAVVIDPELAGGGTAASRFLISAAGEVVATRGDSDPPPRLLEELKPVSSRLDRTSRLGSPSCPISNAVAC